MSTARSRDNRARAGSAVALAVAIALGACGEATESDDFVGSYADASISDGGVPGFTSDAPPPDVVERPKIYFLDGGPSDDGECASRPSVCECADAGCDPPEQALLAAELACRDAGDAFGCGAIEADFDVAGCALRLGFSRYAGNQSCLVQALDDVRWGCLPEGGSVFLSLGSSIGPCGE